MKDEGDDYRDHRADGDEVDLPGEALRLLVRDPTVSRHLTAIWKRIGQLLGIDESARPVIKR